MENYIIPSNYVCPIINDDWSGLNDQEEQELIEFLESLPPGYFTLGESVESYFSTSNDVDGTAGEVMNLIFVTTTT